MTKRLLPALLLSFALFAGLAFTAWHNVAQVLAQSVPTPRAYQNFVDQTGNPCVGCSLYVYLAGTTTPTPTYTDYTRGTPNTNPIILDVAGGAPIWLTPTITYKFVLCEGGTPPSLPCLTYGTVQWTSDQVPGLPGLNTFMPFTGGTFTGAVTGLASTWTSITASTINSLPSAEYKTVSNNPAQLQNWWRYLHVTPTYTGSNGISAGLDVIFPNDSLWEGDWTNSTGCGGSTAVPEYSQNRQAEQIRIKLQAMYGYGGTGLQPIINVANCTTLANPELYTSSPSTLVTSGIIGPQYTTEYSLVQMSTGQVITWNGGGLPYSNVRTYCADNASSEPITVAIDGTGQGTACGTQNGTAIARVATGTTQMGFTSHSATFTCATGPCFMYGAEGRLPVNSGNAGVRVHNLSTGGAPSAWFAGHTDFENLISNGVQSGSAQLVIYAMGTNDADLSVPLSTYEANVLSYFTYEQAKSPEAPVIVIYRPGMDVAPSSSYFAWLTAYGYANNLMVIDQTNRWGKTYIPAAWYLGNDNLHFNDGGNLDAASTILSALIDFERPQPINPIFGDNFLNPGVVSVTGPAYSSNQPLNPGYNWQAVPGIPTNKGIYGFPTGNSLNIAGTIGLLDPTYAGMIWMTNANNDWCIHVPNSGANFSTCAGYHFRVVKSTGAVYSTNNTVDDGSGNASDIGSRTAASFANSQAVVLTTLAGAGSTPTAFTCDAGTTCSPNYGTATGTIGSAPPANGDVLKIAWTTAFTHKAVCMFQTYDSTAGAMVNTFTLDTGNSSSTQAEAFTASALSAAHVVGIHWLCD